MMLINPIDHHLRNHHLLEITNNRSNCRRRCYYARHCNKNAMSTTLMTTMIVYMIFMTYTTLAFRNALFVESSCSSNTVTSTSNQELSIVSSSSSWNSHHQNYPTQLKIKNPFMSSILMTSRSIKSTKHVSTSSLFMSSLQRTRGGSISLSLSSSTSSAEVDTVIQLPKTTPTLPTLLQFRKFAIPCLALWVAGPLLSLVDTSFVGLSGPASQSASQLAALGPATTFFDGATYLFAFLNVATTNLYSSARAQSGEQSNKAEAVVRTSARVAIRCGVGIMIFLFLFTKPLLKLYIGQKAIQTPMLLSSACDYVYIRALSMPTSLLLGVLQASLLGAQDSVTPLVAILYSTIVNFIGDFLLVSVLGYGLQGAAIATTLAQWAGTAALIPAARKRLVRDGNLGFFKKAEQNDDTVSSKSFLSFAAPVLTLILGKLAAFGFMTHVAAAVPNQPTPLASHQIILSLLFFCSPFLEVISQTAQTFLPPFLAPVQTYASKMLKKNPKYDIKQDNDVKPWLDASQKVATSLLGVGFISAACIASIASLVPAFFGYFITSDTIIQQSIKPLAKYLWLGAFIWAPVAVSEGVLLARLELKFLASIYLLSTALLPPALLKIKHNPNGTVGQVWLCFCIFQTFRSIAFMGRIWGVPIFQKLMGGSNRSSSSNTSIESSNLLLSSTETSSFNNDTDDQVVPPINDSTTAVADSTSSTTPQPTL